MTCSATMPMTAGLSTRQRPRQPRVHPRTGATATAVLPTTGFTVPAPRSDAPRHPVRSARRPVEEENDTRALIDTLVAGAVGGDARARDELLVLIHPLVLKYCRGPPGSPGVADGLGGRRRPGRLHGRRQRAARLPAQGPVVPRVRLRHRRAQGHRRLPGDRPQPRRAGGGPAGRPGAQRRPRAPPARRGAVRAAAAGCSRTCSPRASARCWCCGWPSACRRRRPRQAVRSTPGAVRVTQHRRAVIRGWRADDPAASSRRRHGPRRPAVADRHRAAGFGTGDDVTVGRRRPDTLGRPASIRPASAVSTPGRRQGVA